MKTGFNFRALDEAVPLVEVQFGDETLQLPDGANLAAALLAAGRSVFRKTPVSGAPRAPYCMMGACYDCLVEIGGMSVQACMVNVSAGLAVKPGRGRDASG